MFPDNEDRVIITTLARISDMGNHPVSRQELWEEVRYTNPDINQSDIDKTIQKMFAVNMLIYAFDRKLRLVNCTKEEIDALNPPMQTKAEMFWGKPVVPVEFVNNESWGFYPYTFGSFDEYVVPRRISLTVTEEQGKFKATATNPEDEDALNDIIQQMKEEGDEN